MRSLATAALVLAAISALAEPVIPPPAGFVTDTAGVLDPAATARITRLLEELRARTGAEIAVLTVDSTAPLDDFTYAMRVTDAWKPGRKREDTGLLLLLAVKDRKLRVITGYGLEGILPDGLVGQIEDEEIVPALREGRTADGIERGVRAFATRIAAAKGMTLTGVPPPDAHADPLPIPWNLVVVLLMLGLVLLLAYTMRGFAADGRSRRAWRRGPYYGGFGDGFGGGFGGGGGGFGGFGGGSSGGGGAGRSW